MNAGVEHRSRYAFAVPISTRWMDGDPHGHVNNVEYYSYFDTAVTAWLIRIGGLDVRTADVLGLCVESACTFSAPISFPEVVDARVRVGRIGRSSVRYEIGLFREGTDAPAAVGYFVHAYVDRENRRPIPIPAPLRTALSGLVVDPPDEPLQRHEAVVRQS
jgi:acyl-CoA thioester hydrolase